MGRSFGILGCKYWSRLLSRRLTRCPQEKMFPCCGLNLAGRLFVPGLKCSSNCNPVDKIAFPSVCQGLVRDEKEADGNPTLSTQALRRVPSNKRCLAHLPTTDLSTFGSLVLFHFESRSPRSLSFCFQFLVDQFLVRNESAGKTSLSSQVFRTSFQGTSVLSI